MEAMRLRLDCNDVSACSFLMRGIVDAILDLGHFTLHSCDHITLRVSNVVSRRGCKTACSAQETV